MKSGFTTGAAGPLIRLCGIESEQIVEGISKVNYSRRIRSYGPGEDNVGHGMGVWGSWSEVATEEASPSKQATFIFNDTVEWMQARNPVVIANASYL